MIEAPAAYGTALERLCINTVRTLAMDAVEQAKSGHPGTAMALAPLGFILFTEYLRHNPADPHWPGRDRFVLSNGHAAILLYSLLHLTGYKVSRDDLAHYRQWGGITPGHPEHGRTPGVETTTGPLGQGMSNAVGMAMAQAHLAATFKDSTLDHRTWFIASDGDLEEGVSHEAASLAGHLQLGGLIGFYDDNRISIEGDTAKAYSDDVALRFESYHWQVLRVADVNDLPALRCAIEAAQENRAQPSLIIVRSHIAYGSPNAVDTGEAHGAPLGAVEVRRTKKNLGWPYKQTLFVPPAALIHWRKARARGKKVQGAWQKLWTGFARRHPARAAELKRRLAGRLTPRWDRDLPAFPVGKMLATRSASGTVLNALAARVPELIGGSADLSPSTKTLIKASGDFAAGAYAERNLHFGIREHAMGGVMSGMALHGGVIPYGATFLIFSDYMRPAIRLAALMRQHVIYVFTHDSIGLGEDGPTHQPVEQLACLRAIPGLTVLRPADANETAAAWRVALNSRHGPVALVLTRQDVPTLAECAKSAADGVPHGAYVLADSEQTPPDAVLLASGSEVALALDARKQLREHGLDARVVSVPSLELFAQQTARYRDEVLPPAVKLRVAIEAGSLLSWWRMVGDAGGVVGLDHYGASAAYERIYSEFGITADALVKKVLSLRPPAPGKKGRLHALLQQGQSPWLDHLRRELVTSGELASLVERGLRGITSNPSIFEKAIVEHNDYDDALAGMPKKLSDEAAFERLAIADVQAAADALRGVYDDSGGSDGLVSLEVAPRFARDTAGTVKHVRRLWLAVNRPNVMIKIPGTEQGWPAIEQSLAAGINVNVTLLFSIRHYREVAEAYLRALEARRAQGLSIARIASVASFFVSRVDTAVEARLKNDPAGLKKFGGKVGIANARLAYGVFEEIIAGARWKALAARGAQVQRLLWASTGAKNPHRSDLLYVDNLIGPDTVNTLPPATLAAFEAHGTVASTLRGHAREAQALMRALDGAGVRMTEVARELEDEGIAKFSEAYYGLLAAIAKKRRR